MLGHRTLTFEDYIDILKRRGWMIAIPAVIVPVIAIAVSFYLTPKYTSKELILIEQQKVPDAYVKPVTTEDLDSRLALLAEQVLSRSRIEPIVERFNLGNPKMGMDERIVSTRKDIVLTPIHSEIVGSGGLPGFYISFEGATDARTAQLVCREISTLFVSGDLQSRQESAEGTTAFLKGQLAQAKDNLDAQDAKLAAFQSQYVGALPDEQAPNMNMLTSLNTQLDASTQALARDEQNKSVGEALLAGQMSDAPAQQEAVTPQVQGKESELQQLQAKKADLMARYTPSYPDVIAIDGRIEELQKEIAQTPAPSNPSAPSAPRRSEPLGIQQLRAQLRALDQAIEQEKHKQAKIQSQIHQYQGRIESTPLVESKFKELTRDYQTAQDFYNSLLKNMNQSQMATDLEHRQEGEQFSVMDDANLPDAPTFPNRMVFAGGGFAGGLALGLLLVALLEYRDTSLRTERDILAFTKLPTLAIIASIKQADLLEGQSLSKRSKKKLKASKESLASAGG